MTPYDRQDGTRCLIVKPGDVLILRVADVEHAEWIEEVGSRLKELLSLRMVLVAAEDVEISVRDVDAELAKQQDSLDSYATIFETMHRLQERTQDDLDAARNQIAELMQRPA